MDKKLKERKEPKVVVSCGAVTWKLDALGEPEVLLIKQFINDDVWGMPKGHMNVGENYTQCAVREVKEETGVSVVLLERLPDCQSLSWKKNKTVVSFLAVPEKGTSLAPIHTGEHSEVADARWFTFNEVKKLRLVTYQAPVVEEAMRLIRERIASETK